MSPYGEWFDKETFLARMKERLDVPVYNILDEKV
jgi:hypothetical protein